MSERKGTKALELWCKRLVKDCPNVHIDNMTTSWRDGIAFCALVHYFKPDLIDVSKLKPEDIYANNQLAYSIAEKYLGIPSLLDPEDMVENEIPDRLSILTYLSQFYQRLGHTVSSPKAVENENQIPSSSGTQLAPFKFGKAGLDKCAACGLPVYLAQRLLVSNKLYHRRCFLCSKCLGHLNPKNFVMVDGSEFTCDSCKNEKNVSKFNNNDQMGMLAFSDDLCPTPNINKNCEPDSLKHIAQVSRPQSILEKINMFERNAATTTSIEKDIANITIKDRSNLVETNSLHSPSGAPPDNNQHVETIIQNVIEDKKTESNHEADEILKVPELEMSETYKYKSDVNKFNFLQTQLINSNDNQDSIKKDLITDIEFKEDSIKISDEVDKKESKELPHTPLSVPDKGVLDSNVTDDSRLASCYTSFADTSSNTAQNDEPEISISVPPRRKKQGASPNKTKCAVESTNTLKASSNTELYPDHLNPFSEDEEETETAQTIKKVSSNPFGSSDEEDDVVPPIPTPSKAPPAETTKRLISANPFWSEGEEPSSDEEISDQSASLNKSSIATSTPSLVSSTPRRKKGKAPPPPCILVNEAPAAVEGALPPLSEGPQQATSMDDVASLSSLSSFNSTAHSDQKSFGPLTPMLKKKRLAPTPPDSLSTVSGYGGSMEKGVDTAGDHGKDLKRTKGPAPGLPLPSRRAVRLAVSPEQLQTQLELLETQQLGLERQGVLVERMIRDKCEGDDATEVPQEEVEDLVIQLCELVNEKNDLFRKQTELMYIRRQQRLEQEQADIEHEIRVLQSRPAVNRIDADKAREEQLVSRLVDIVRLRDELVQQIESERRRERQEDIAIATSIANKRAQRNSDSNSSTIKSAEVETTQKKSKVKDKVKKQLKKAKHTLISKKKDEDKEKEKKPK